MARKTCIQDLKEVGFKVCEPYFHNEAAMTTFVLKSLDTVDKTFAMSASEKDLVDYWEGKIEQVKQMVQSDKDTPYEPKPWECLYHFIN